MEAITSFYWEGDTTTVRESFDAFISIDGMTNECKIFITNDWYNRGEIIKQYRTHSIAIPKSVLGGSKTKYLLYYVWSEANQEWIEDDEIQGLTD